MLVSVEVELIIYTFALFKGIAGLHLALQQRKADNAPWYRQKLRSVEGAIIVILLASVLTLFTVLLQGITKGVIHLTLEHLAVYFELVSTVLLAIFMAYVILAKVGCATITRK